MITQQTCLLTKELLNLDFHSCTKLWSRMSLRLSAVRPTSQLVKSLPWHHYITVHLSLRHSLARLSEQVMGYVDISPLRGSTWEAVQKHKNIGQACGAHILCAHLLPCPSSNHSAPSWTATSFDGTTAATRGTFRNYIAH
jgi:hypothetical protein